MAAGDLVSQGKRIAQGLAAHGLTKTAYARQYGVTHTVLVDLCSGRTPGNRAWLARLARDLGTTVEYLRHGTGPAPSWAADAPPSPEAQALSEVHAAISSLASSLDQRRAQESAAPAETYTTDNAATLVAILQELRACRQELQTMRVEHQELRADLAKLASGPALPTSAAG